MLLYKKGKTSPRWFVSTMITSMSNLSHGMVSRTCQQMCKLDDEQEKLQQFLPYSSPQILTGNGFIELVVHLYLSSFDVKAEQVDGGVAHREEDAGEREALEPDVGDDGGDAVADGDKNDVFVDDAEDIADDDGDGGADACDADVDGDGGDGDGEGKVEEPLSVVDFVLRHHPGHSSVCCLGRF